MTPPVFTYSWKIVLQEGGSVSFSKNEKVFLQLPVKRDGKLRVVVKYGGSRYAFDPADIEEVKNFATAMSAIVANFGRNCR